MSDFELSDFEITRELDSRPQRKVFSATNQSGENIRLTVFSAEISQSPEFRRAMKTDRAMLSILQHQAILKFHGIGESDGALFFWTGNTQSQPLSVQLDRGRKFSSEDVIEIGWQICSALQQAHNRGVVHGGLSLDTVLLSENLQVTLIDFGVARWLRAGTEKPTSSASGPALITVSALASREEVEKDLADLACILVHLLQTSGDPSEAPDSGHTSTRSLLERLLNRMSSSDPSQRPGSAREFQGRLGEILIGTDGDAMPLVDHRQSLNTSKRSIIVELFEPPESAESSGAPVRQPAGFAWRRQILPILAVIAVVAILVLLAGLLF